MIVMIKAGQKNDHDHVLIVDKVNYNLADCHIDATKNKNPQSLNYVHSFVWNKDGKYNGGVKEGKIIITNVNKGLLDQTWQENGKIGQDNETFLHAKQAKLLDIRRLNVLM